MATTQRHTHIIAEEADGQPFECIEESPIKAQTARVVIANCGGRIMRNVYCTRPIAECRRPENLIGGGPPEPAPTPGAPLAAPPVACATCGKLDGPGVTLDYTATGWECMPCRLRRLDTTPKGPDRAHVPPVCEPHSLPDSLHLRVSGLPGVQLPAPPPADPPQSLRAAVDREARWECDCGHLQRTHDLLGVCQATHCACQDGNYRCPVCGEPTGLCAHTQATPEPDPQTPAAREAAQRADEAELQAGLLATLPPMAGGSEDDAQSARSLRATLRSLLAASETFALDPGNPAMRQAYEAMMAEARKLLANGEPATPGAGGILTEQLKALTNQNRHHRIVQQYLVAALEAAEAHLGADFSADNAAYLKTRRALNVACEQARDHLTRLDPDHMPPMAGGATQEEPVLATLPNGQEIRGTVQPDGTVLVTDWPQSTVTSTHPHGVIGALVEYLDPALYREKYLGAASEE